MIFLLNFVKKNKVFLGFWRILKDFEFHVAFFSQIDKREPKTFVTFSVFLNEEQVMTFNTEKCCSDVLLFSTANIAKKNLRGFGVHVSWMNIIMPSKKTKTLLAPSFIWFKNDFWISAKNTAIPFFVALFLSKQQENSEEHLLWKILLKKSQLTDNFLFRFLNSYFFLTTQFEFHDKFVFFFI